MALIPKDKYNGRTLGRRKATPAERYMYGRTRYPADAHPGQTVQRLIKSNNGKFTPVWAGNATGNITIVVRYEIWNNYKKQWEKLTVNDRSIDRQMKFYNMQAVIDYVLSNMRNKPNTKPSKRMISGDKMYEYFISTPKPGMVWNKVTKQWEKGPKEFSNNPNWSIKPMFFSQWVTIGSQWLTRTTFEQVDDIAFDDHDYHNPKPSPWSHNGIITPKDGTRARSVRTYLNADKEDTTSQRNQAYWHEKRAIQREYDNYTRESLNMSPQEYREYKHDMEHMSDEEWHKKYGVNHSYYND